MTLNEITTITNILAIKTAIVFYLLYLVVSYFCRKKALKRIKENLQEGEVIVYEPKFSYVAEIVFPLAIGGFLGGFIIPFFIYPNLQYVRTSASVMSRNSLPFWIICELILIFALGFVSCWKYAITNKRIITAYTFKFIYKFGKIIDIKFSNISHLEMKEHKAISLKLLYIWLKDETNVMISGFKDIEKVKSIIENQINLQK